MWQHHRPLFIALLILTAARLVLAGTLELSADEAYYHLWTKFMDWSFYSKGPGVASAMWASTSIFGDNAFGVRFWSPLLGFGTSLLLYRLARGIFDGTVAAWSVVVLNASPIFNAGSIVMTIDPPSVFFWVLALQLIWSALHRASPWSAYWLAAGFAIGIGFLFKYTNAFLFVGLITLIATVPRWRPLWKKPGPWILVGAFLVCTLPVLYWNSRHGWITLVHLLERGRIGESTGYSIMPLLEYLGLHAGVYSPLLFIGLLWGLVWGLRRHAADHRVAFLTSFSAPIVLFYFFLSLKETGEPNWTAPGFVGLGILTVHAFHRTPLGGGARAGIRVATLGLAILVCVLSLNLDLLRRAGLPLPYSRDPLVRLRGGVELAQAAAGFTREHTIATGREPFLITQRYQLAAMLHHYLPEDASVFRPTPEFPRAFIGESPAIRNQFSFFPRYDQRTPDAEPASPFIGRDALYLDDSDESDGVPEEVRQAFADVQAIGLVEVQRLGRPAHRLTVFRCLDYRGTEL
jgi:4-amino-4-deoxy-L-arabinose transferase-like glycosyltransferase